MDNLIGQHVGPYRIVEQLGTGGMATVYKAYQPAMERYVALKVIASHFAPDQTFLQRFHREAQAVAQVEHAHILPVYDYGEAEGRPYLVMRYLDAGTLKERMARGPLPWSEVNRIVGQVGSALDYAHRMGIIHRDVKPSNVLLDTEGNAFLTDFGLAKVVESSAQLTGTGVGVGTPAYMSPEQGKGAKVDSRTDIYSLGVMLYEMVTGRPPYEADTPLAVVLKHITEPLPLPRAIRPDLPEEVERVILKALAKEPADRFQTAGEMVRALDAAVRAATAAMPTELGARVEPSIAEVSAPPTRRPPAQARPGARERVPARWGRVAMWAAVGGVALVVLFLALSRVPLRVQISGGQLEVIRVVEATATPTGGVAATSTLRPAATPTSQAILTPTPAPTQMPSTALRWEPLTEAIPVVPVALNTLAIDSHDPDTIFAGTWGAGIYVSHDGGQTWEPSNEGLGKGTVSRIVIDPRDSDVVYAALFAQGGVYKSADGGRTWTAANRGINLDEAWHDAGFIYFDPADSRRLYYSNSVCLYHSSDAGATWEQRSRECPVITRLAIDPGDGEHLYASGSGSSGSSCLAGVYESRDGGRTWERRTSEEMAAPEGDWWHLATDPKDFSILYAGGARETYKTSDGGQSWTRMLDHACNWLAASEMALYCGTDDTLWISADEGRSWGEAPCDSGRDRRRLPFAVVPGNPQVLYAGDDALAKSADGGWTWIRVGVPGAIARTRLTVDPRDGQRLFLSGVDQGHEVLRSKNGGTTWQSVGIYGAWDRRITIDPLQNLIYLPSYPGNLHRSRDDGETWEKFGSGDIANDPMQLVLDPQDPTRLWLMNICGTRPAVSEDNGETFSTVENFPQPLCMPLLLMHGDGQRMYVMNSGGFYRSDDGGETWRSLGDLGGDYHAAALDPSNPDVVYAGSTHEGVFKTENGGLTWRQVNAGLTSPSINELALDPANPQTVYAATDNGAFVSVDGGEHWSPIQEGLGPNPIVYFIAVDPNDRSRVYAVTPDGIFRLAGAPPTTAGSAPSGLP